MNSRGSRSCEWCGRLLSYRRRDARHCSDRCRVLGWRRQRRYQTDIAYRLELDFEEAARLILGSGREGE